MESRLFCKWDGRVTTTGLPLIALGLAVAGCVQTQWQASGYGPSQAMHTADQTMDVEVADRTSRFGRLANLQGVTPPRIEEVMLPPNAVPGANRPIPVIRVTFEERDFFDPGSAAPRPQAMRVLQVVAENMRRDVPDVRVTVLGHTDASGTDQQNLALSQSRAQSVIQLLVQSGVNPGQFSAVAIGRAQPIAPNGTPSGRARNRRVEFLISPNEQANLAVVSIRSVNPAFLAFDGVPEHSARRQVTVLKATYSGPTDFSEAPAAPGQAGRVSLAASGSPLTVGDNESGSPVSAAPRSTTRIIADGPTEGGNPAATISASFAPARP